MAKKKEEEKITRQIAGNKKNESHGVGAGLVSAPKMVRKVFPMRIVGRTQGPPLRHAE